MATRKPTMQEQAKETGDEVERKARQDPGWHDDSKREPYYSKVLDPKSDLPEAPVNISPSDDSTKGDDVNRINHEIGLGNAGLTRHGNRAHANPDASSEF